MLQGYFAFDTIKSIDFTLHSRFRKGSPPLFQTKNERVSWDTRSFYDHIFSGAATPSRARQLAMTLRTLSASFRRAASTPLSSPLMRQAL